MRSNLPLAALARYKVTHISVVNVAAYSLIMLLAFALLIHSGITLTRSEVLKTYTRDQFSKAEQAAFQMQKSLELTQVEKKEPCSDADLESLRKIKQTYFFIGDLGRISNNKIICTVLGGVLDSPIPLPLKHTKASNGLQYLNSQTGLMRSYKKLPMITYEDAVVYSSPAYLNVTKRYFSTVYGMSGVTYFDAGNSDKRFIHSYFGHILPQEFDTIITHKNSFSDWLPLPNKIRSETQCNHLYNICTTAADRNLGLYSLSRRTVSFLIPVMFFVSIIIGLLIEFSRSGPRVLVRGLKKQIQQDNIFPVYQPQVNIETREVVGVESLSRWVDPRSGPISPEIFIRIAEEVHLIEKLTTKVIIKIFNELHEILEAKKSFTVSLNVSAKLLTSDTFVNFLNQETSKYGFNRNQVVLEVTERSSSNKYKMASFSKKLQEQGYLVSIDDFGTGVSNLSWLSTLEPHEIKVDKTFTQAIDTETVNSITLEGIFSMLEHLKVKVVFEGIETEQQRDYIQNRISGAIGQGWLFAKPKKIEELKKYLGF